MNTKNDQNVRNYDNRGSNNTVMLGLLGLAALMMLLFTGVAVYGLSKFRTAPTNVYYNNIVFYDGCCCHDNPNSDEFWSGKYGYIPQLPLIVNGNVNGVSDNGGYGSDEYDNDRRSQQKQPQHEGHERTIPGGRYYGTPLINNGDIYYVPPITNYGPPIGNTPTSYNPGVPNSPPSGTPSNPSHPATPVQPVPEPSSGALFAMGLVLVGMKFYKRIA